MSRTIVVGDDTKPTRRDLIARLAVAGAASVAGACLIARRAAAAPAKLPPNQIGYQDAPRGSARCELCVNWQAPNACKLVAGQISPSG